jgi:hypothetical protein
MGQDFSSGEVRQEEGVVIGISKFSFDHALLLATDAAHRIAPNKSARIEYQVTLGENPPINEWKVLVIPGGG